MARGLLGSICRPGLMGWAGIGEYPIGDVADARWLKRLLGSIGPHYSSASEMFCSSNVRSDVLLRSA